MRGRGLAPNFDSRRRKEGKNLWNLREDGGGIGGRRSSEGDD